MSAVIELRNVDVSYSSGAPWARRSFEALKSVNLQVAVGETVGLVGESGSGKTTTGRLCLGLQRPTSGEVLFRGDGAHDRRRTKQGVRFAAVLQHPRTSLNPRLTVASSIAEPLVIAGERRSETAERVAFSLERVGLRTDLALRYPHELSGGQRQRASIARALIGEPDFILFDEPVSALDASVQAQILNLILDLQAELRFAALFISHDFAATRYVAKRLAVMQAGRIVDEAQSSELFKPSRHPYTLALQRASGLLD